MEPEKYFDLSTLSYGDFLLYFLAHPENDELWTRDMSGAEYAYWTTGKSNPEAIVRHENQPRSERSSSIRASFSVASVLPLTSMAAGGS